MIGGLPVTYGTYYFVDYDNGSDGNTGKSSTKAFKTLSKANDSVTTNKHDVVLLSGYSAHVLTEMLSITKNRVHFIGLGGPASHYGQRSRVTMGVTTATANTAMVKNTGVGNTFTGIKFASDDTLTQGVDCFAEGGEYTKFYGCEFYKSTHLGVSAASELLLNGDSCQFYNCTFGSLVDTVTDNYIRPAVRLAREVITGKVCRDCYFENCLFWKKAGGTETQFVHAAGATDVERMLMFKDCTFINAKLGAALPAHAVGCAAAQTEGNIILKNCTAVRCTIMAEASVAIYVDGAVPTFASTGVAKLTA